MADRRLIAAFILLLGGCSAPRITPPPVRPPPLAPPPVAKVVANVPVDALDEGVQALSEGRPSDARADLERAVAETPDDPVAVYLLSQVTGDGADRAVALGGHGGLFNPSPPAQPSPPRRVAVAGPSPQVRVPPQPHPIATLPSPSATPAPQPVAPPAPPAPAPRPTEAPLPDDKIMVQGTVTRPDAQGTVGPLAGRQVTLLALGAGVVAQTETDMSGQFWFEPQEPRYDYYLIVISPMAAEATTVPVLQPVAGPHGGVSYLPLEERVETRHDMSWHQALDLSNAGIYTLTLSADNADATFCSDVQPTFDSGSHTAFNAFRVGAPSFQAAPQHR